MSETSRPTHEFPSGVRLLPYYLDDAAQRLLLEDVRAVVACAPLYTPTMPRSGVPMSVRMTNCGTLGWVTDKEHGYRYQPTHPETGRPWPAIPEALLALWADVSGFDKPPEACLVNFYDPDAKMGLHQDRDEADLSAPVLSVSLGDTAVFRIGGAEGGRTHSLKLASGDVCALTGPARLARHGVDRVLAGSSRLIPGGGRLNLTLRCAG